MRKAILAALMMTAVMATVAYAEPDAVKNKLVYVEPFHAHIGYYTAPTKALTGEWERNEAIEKTLTRLFSLRGTSDYGKNGATERTLTKLANLGVAKKSSDAQIHVRTVGVPSLDKTGTSIGTKTYIDGKGVRTVGRIPNHEPVKTFEDASKIHQFDNLQVVDAVLTVLAIERYAETGKVPTAVFGTAVVDKDGVYMDIKDVQFE